MRFSTQRLFLMAGTFVIILLVSRFVLGVTETFLSVQELQTEIGNVDVNALPDPAILLKSMRGLLDKYDRPEYVEHARRVMHMDPGELARMQIAAQE
jgi:hypothetical protein